MIEPRDALAALREAWHEEDQAEAQMSVADYDGEKRTAERRLTAARAAAREAEAAVGVHLGDEGLRAAVRDFLTYDVDGESDGWTRWDDKIDALRAALAAQENPMSVSQLQTDTALTPSLDDGLLARAARELPEEYWPSMEHHEWCDEDSGGSHRFDREWWSSDIAAAIAAEYRRLAQEGETP